VDEDRKDNFGESADRRRLLNRRRLIVGIGGLATAAFVTAHSARLLQAQGYEPLLRLGDSTARRLQRLIMPDRPLAPEFRADQRTAHFPTNGGFGTAYIEPDPAYDRLLAGGFRDWRLTVDGLVDRPGRFSLADLCVMPQRTQITMHSCDMGWSAIGEWTGVPLRWLLEHAGIRERGRYIVFHCMDRLIGGLPLYSSIDRLDAFHPQTLLAYRMNGAPLPKNHGAPLRLRTELQIGYKQSKHIQRVSVVESLNGLGLGYGGTFEDMGFQWYAGM
jgi:DMSO/TMAO reductase YedYZ molybdopterin-dependent catalytic subunit